MPFCPYCRRPVLLVGPHAEIARHSHTVGDRESCGAAGLTIAEAEARRAKSAGPTLPVSERLARAAVRKVRHNRNPGL